MAWSEVVTRLRGQTPLPDFVARRRCQHACVGIITIIINHWNRQLLTGDPSSYPTTVD
jgi:hypothetical protein